MRKKLLFSFILYTLTYMLSASPALAATLSLSPASGTFGKSCSFSTQVLIDTQGVETDGADIILLFDPTQLNASSIVNGSIYSDFPGNTIDNTTGKVSIFALAPSTKGFTGKGTVATVNFTTTANASSSAALKFDFDPNNLSKTTDSNVIERATLKDVLKSVTNGNYNLSSNSVGCKALASATPIPKGGPTSLPDSGTSEVTWMVGGLGMILILLGLLGLRKYRLSERC